MNYLDAEEILLIHYKLIERYGGSHGVRDLSRVKSAAVAPSQEVYGQEQYLNIFEKAAVYIRNLIGDHPFYDGNKRAGMAAADIFLRKNGYKIKAQKGEVEDFAVHVATDQMDVPAIATWLKAHIAEIE